MRLYYYLLLKNIPLEIILNVRILKLIKRYPIVKSINNCETQMLSSIYNKGLTNVRKSKNEVL